MILSAKTETSLIIIEANNIAEKRRSWEGSQESAKGENGEVFMHITSRVSIMVIDS